mgnify:CR=1 FL=1
MIELNIPLNAATALLIEKMQNEMDMRIRTGKIMHTESLKDLEYAELSEIAEAAAFDLVFLLPAEVYEDENNLPSIITKAMHLLSHTFSKTEFLAYSEVEAAKLIKPIRKMFDISREFKVQIYN